MIGVIYVVPYVGMAVTCATTPSAFCLLVTVHPVLLFSVDAL